MKKIILSTVMVVFLLGMATTTYAVKPTGNLAGAEKVGWNLSAEVMPVPPYGSGDIPGSDTASKLIVNQPNGNTEVAMTGVMNGLNPNTTYTVYLSNEYDPYVETGWNVTGDYILALTVGSTPYTEYLNLIQTGNDVGGTMALNLEGTQSLWVIDSGTVDGDTITFSAYYDTNTAMEATFSATIAADGSLINGSWEDVSPRTRSGLWASTDGEATKTHTGNTGWSGLFTSTIQPFTFTTDEFGSGSWHLNLRDENFGEPGDHTLSVWINGSGTMLISNNFDVATD